MSHDKRSVVTHVMTCLTLFRLRNRRQNFRLGSESENRREHDGYLFLGLAPFGLPTEECFHWAQVGANLQKGGSHPPWWRGRLFLLRDFMFGLDCVPNTEDLSS